MANNNSSQQRLLIIAGIIIAVLLLTNGILLFNKYKQDDVVDTQAAQLDESNKLKIELEKQYQEALSELEEMRGSNDELNAIIDQQKEELRQQKAKIDGLLASGNEVGRAKAEMKNMRSQVAGYVAEIERMKTEIEGLKGERDQLTSRTQALTANLDSVNVRASQLEGEKSALTAEKQQLTTEKTELTEKVTLGSAIKVDKITVTPLKERNSGKTVKKKFAKNVDQLKICFTTSENRVARPGNETFYVRLLNPVGETMAIDELGSGIFHSKEHNDKIRYTYMKDYDYNQDAAEVCFNWDPNVGAFSKGKYTVEVYNKGYITGKSTFDLK
jgi:predicted nuclease with TOPRIM domain